jgi:hypothetical protein
MSLNTDFGEMEAAAQDLRAILANLSEGNAMAAPPTTGILPAGVDEVSAAITALFNTHGRTYQQLATAAQEFHQQFANLLSSARAAYEDTEIASGQMLRTAIDDMEQPFVPMLESARMINKPLTQTTAIPTNVNPLNSEIQTQLATGNKVTAFGFSQSSLVATDELRNLMAQGSPGHPLLLSGAAQHYLATETAAEQALRNEITILEQPFDASFFDAHFGAPPTDIQPIEVPTNSAVGLIVGGMGMPYPSWVLQPVHTLYTQMPSISSIVHVPGQFWPVTPEYQGGVFGGGLTLGQSSHLGAQVVLQAIQTELAAGNKVTVWAYSEGTMDSISAIRTLIAQGSPNVNQLSFVLAGDGNNPDGGIFERFTGTYIPFLDILFSGSMPANNPYPTVIYSNQYDAIADFPKYPTNVLADLNAWMGTLELDGTHDYFVNPNQVSSAIQLPTSPGYAGNTTYYMTLTQNLPLVQPLRSLGTVGNAVADLLQPDLRVLVDMGYSDWGVGGDYANIPTPGQLFAIPNLPVVVPDLINGAVQGVHATGVDLGLLPKSMFPDAYPYVPTLNPDVNLATGQSSTTIISTLGGIENQVMQDLEQIPSWWTPLP